MDEEKKALLQAYDPKELLLFVLKHYEIEIQHVGENTVEVEGDFTIEVEGVLLYKLLWKGLVIAPFNDLDQLCANISMELSRD
ncbi:MAG TPA: hypothetical protein DCM08_10460 [Microscillaceae bacterium]|jgi:hypothetical protein|nr:hypothetical protein [Microscillaceae bacterium]